MSDQELWLSQADIDRLAPYCPCLRCAMWGWNPFRVLVHPADHDCIKTGFTTQLYVSLAETESRRNLTEQVLSALKLILFDLMT